MATGRYAHQIGAWDNATPYIGTEAPSFGHRLAQHGHKITTIGKLHYRSTNDPNGFADQRVPMHVLEGVGDLYGLLRGEMPTRPDSRNQVLNAGPGESDYIRFDREIADMAAEWLNTEGKREDRPWCLVVGFVSPHFPLRPPQSYFDLFRPEDIPMPVAWRQEEWAHHPVIDLKRRQEALEVPFEEAQVRNALHAYYALVTFLDEQIGVVMDGLRRSGQKEKTRVIYTSDHGEMIGEHGLWWKSTMYESSVAVPLIISGPGLRRKRQSPRIRCSLIYSLQFFDAVGAPMEPFDVDLPGRSLLKIANSDDADREAFSEYHAIFSPSGIFMLRRGRFKYVHYVGYQPQLFDLVADPDEGRDLAGDPGYADVLASCESALRSICDPEALDAAARFDQKRRMDSAGGAEVILNQGVRIPFTPTPEEFAQ